MIARVQHLFIVSGCYRGGGFCSNSWRYRYTCVSLTMDFLSGQGVPWLLRCIHFKSHTYTCACDGYVRTHREVLSDDVTGKLFSLFL